MRFNRTFQRHAFVFAVVILLFAAACSKAPPPKRYELQGRVVAVDTGTRQITVAHDDVPGLMKGMTMPFEVSKQDNWVFGHIAPGDSIHATLVLSDHAQLENITFVKNAGGVPAGVSGAHEPQPGDQPPNFALTNQDGHTVRFSQLRGKPLLLTFIYTNCPFPDFCPRMSANFAAVLRQLQKDPKAFADAQLLSISIDPQHDTPATLRTYGERYNANLNPGFQHWQFVTASSAEVRKLADFFGLTYDQQNGQIIHSLQTVLLGKDGKVLKVYSGNEWKPADVAADFAQAAGE